MTEALANYVWPQSSNLSYKFLLKTSNSSNKKLFCNKNNISLS